MLGRENDLIRDIAYHEKECKLSATEIMKKFLYELQFHAAFVFYTFFLAINKESLTPFWIGISPSAVTLYLASFVPFQILSLLQIESIKLESTSLNLELKSFAEEDSMSVRSDKKKKKSSKEAKKNRKSLPGDWDVTAFEDVLAFTEKTKKSTAFLVLKDERLNELALTLLSRSNSSSRLCELFEYYSQRLLEGGKMESLENIVDDPKEFGIFLLILKSLSLAALSSIMLQSLTRS